MSQILTAANQLTLLRLLLVPVFALCMLYRMPGWALVTFAVAGVTDALDGLVARRLGQSSLGAWLDPMADKLLLLTMFVALTVPGLGLPNRLPVYVAVVVISRDVAIVLTVAIFNLAVARRTFRPSWLGKLATATYIFTGVVALYANYRGEVWGFVNVCADASVVVTVVSALDYVRRFTRGGPSAAS